MSNRKICVCGRERGKEPVIITITTCRHKHPPKKEDSFTISTPLATSSPTDLSSKNKTSNQQSRSEGKNKGIISENEDKEKSQKEKNESLKKKDENENQTESLFTSANEMDSTFASATEGESAIATGDPTVDSTNAGYSTNNKTTDDSEVADTTRNETFHSGYSADDSTRFPNSTLEESEITGYETADEELDDSTQNNETNVRNNNPTIMFHTETAINTMPFLDNLFWTKSATSKSMPNISKDHCDQGNCSMEVFIFEKHSQLCRHHAEGIKKQNYFFDGDTLFETLGRISLPHNCNDFKPNTSKSEKLAAVYSRLKENFSSKSHFTKTDFYEEAFKTIDNFVKNKRFFDTLNNKRSEPLNVKKLQKYITMGDDIYQKQFKNSASGSNIEELYFRKTKTDQSIQFEEFYINPSDNKSAKWYDIFLMCFGLKDREETYGVNNLKEQLLPTESSILIRKYLRI